ncbi:isopeptide-forming domain-containing fimbrial protein [Cutibacterium sp. WCA-380-WT-3A]|uniref:Isopeptide-forming domain-containing fimbrial protein n=1 Tax=Cutibacterium porci TaxID=2605781 RepID=A0A7K0J4B7_9ACTN|nr:SpaH/EbpB family LPXTG-anchored major pilin [Cutibacterium porci]MSS44775.1 isopeptide-forming domain-containing fimbrial protein [Cutibacterium porci]
MRSFKPLCAALTASILTFGSLAAPALADETGAKPDPSPATVAATDSVDANHAVSLTIKKLIGDPTNDTSNLKGLADVEFKVEKINVDLTTTSGWETLSGMNASNAPIDGSVSFGNIKTGADGVARISTDTDANFKVGAYRITELQKGSYTVAPPFIVTLPFSDNGTWNYDQTVQPKNQDVKPNKQVDDTGATVGKPLAYTINAPVPAGDLSRMVITDPLVNELTLDPASVKVTASGTNGDVALATTDYTVTAEDHKLVVTFTDAGLTKLQDQRKNDPSLQVHVAFKATVTSIPASGGKVTNTATVDLPNGGTITTDTNDQPTSTTFATLTVTKTAQGTDAASLSGAQFKLYLCKKDDSTGKYQLLGNPIQVASSNDQGATLTDTLTTDNTATVKGFGIPATSFSGGDTGEQANQYCVLETKAPDGFFVNPEAQPVAYDRAANSLTASVEDKKDTVLGQLPATGAWGLLIVLVVGGGLVARGVYVSRRDKDQASA